MLKSEINELELSVGAILEMGFADNLPAYQKQVTEKIAAIRHLCFNIKKRWTQELLSNAKEQVIKRYVQYHQAGIIQLSDEVSKQVPAVKITEEIRSFWLTILEQLHVELENILDFLHSKFYQYFDIDHRTSRYYCQQLIEKIVSFETDLLGEPNLIDNSLIECVLQSAKDLVNEGFVSGISYRWAQHGLNIVRMTHHLTVFGSNPTTKSLMRSLYQQNFNTLYFFNWYQAYIATQLNEIITDKGKDQFIQDELKSFAGIYVNPEKALEPDLPATDNFITRWLENQSVLKPLLVKSAQKEQFPLNLSVPQFALFIRIFYKTGCFPVENVTMITRFFSEHFTTKKQPHISQKSFGRAFYNLDQSAAAVVRDFLQKMLNYLNKTYFP